MGRVNGTPRTSARPEFRPCVALSSRNPTPPARSTPLMTTSVNGGQRSANTEPRQSRTTLPRVLWPSQRLLAPPADRAAPWVPGRCLGGSSWRAEVGELHEQRAEVPVHRDLARIDLRVFQGDEGLSMAPGHIPGASGLAPGVRGDDGAVMASAAPTPSLVRGTRAQEARTESVYRQNPASESTTARALWPSSRQSLHSRRPIVRVHRTLGAVLSLVGRMWYVLLGAGPVRA